MEMEKFVKQSVCSVEKTATLTDWQNWHSINTSQHLGRNQPAWKRLSDDFKILPLVNKEILDFTQN